MASTDRMAAPVLAPERRSGSGRPFAVTALALFVLLAGANLATPLYAVYRERFGFSSATLTVIFASYAIVLVVTLPFFGQLSDRLGRRRMIASGLAIGMVAQVLFVLATGVGWLLAARIVQGLALGVASGAAGAALVELEPHGDARRAALLSTLAQAGGCAAGPALAGALAEWAPAPRMLCYLVGLCVTGLAALAVLRVPETAPPARGSRRLTRPGVPRGIRADFVRVAVTASASWAVAAVFLSVVPSYAGDLLASDDLALLGAISALMLCASCAGQLIGRRAESERHAQAVGLGLLAAGLASLVLAFPARSLALVLAAAVLTGVGHGLGFLGAQGEVNRIAPPERRGEVTAAFYGCIYLGVAVLVISLGLVGLEVALSSAVAAFAAVVGLTAVLTAAWHAAGGRHTRARPD